MTFITSLAPTGIRYAEGNLIDALERGAIDYAAQGCNCFTRMGRGLAGEVRRRIPAAVTADQASASGDPAKLGTYTGVEWPAGSGRRFINGYTQFHWNERRNNEPLNDEGLPILCDYDAVRDLLRRLHTGFRADWVLGLPLIGCGLARGDWGRVAAIIDEELVTLGRAVTVYVLDRQQLPERFRAHVENASAAD